MAPAGRTRLRRPTIVTAPMVVVGLMGCSAAVALVIWGAWEGHERSGTWLVLLVVASVVGAGGFAAASGCFVDLRDDDVRDVVAWFTVHRFDRRRVRTVRVARGVWRLFVVELDDGTRFHLLGASPEQWLTRLVPGSPGRDLADIDLLIGEEP